MKFKELQALDQNIIKALASHKGMNNAVNGYNLASLTWLDKLIGG